MTFPLRTFALVGALALGLAACKKAPEQQAPPTPEVGVVEARPQTLPLQRELVGRLSPFRSADVRARVSGVLLKRLYEEGHAVKQGQPVATRQILGYGHGRDRAEPGQRQGRNRPRTDHLHPR